MRVAASLVLTLAALAALFVAAGAFKNVVVAHPDGPKWAYALIALVCVGVAAGLLAIAWRGRRAAP